MYITNNKIMLSKSVSDQNVYFSYVCLVDDMNPNTQMPNNVLNKPSYDTCKLEDEDIDNDDEPIQVEKCKAVHQLVESQRTVKVKSKEQNDNNEKDSTPACSITHAGQENVTGEDNFLCFANPNILKLTKMKWLTEDKNGALDSSSSSLSPSSSLSSNLSKGSNENEICLNDRYLSTILRLDKEHNMFGLSNIAIDGTRPSKKIRKDDERAVFYQTAIVQICCGKGCCKHKSNTDLPSSLKCSGCQGCCVSPSCPVCVGPCGPPYEIPACQPIHSSCPPSKCLMDRSTCFGLKISLNKKPTFEVSPVEVTPRSSCVLQKPLAARSCHHLPHCIPPSSCFSYLMPCFWPARAGAPCSNPARCFHNPPCPPPRKRKSIIPPQESCSKTGKCEDIARKTKCQNISCLGNNVLFKKEIDSRYGKR